MDTQTEMPIKGGKDPLLTELERDLGLEETGGSSDKSFHELYAQLTLQEEVILVIDAQDEQRVREGLSVVKARHVAKMKESNVKVPIQKLSFIKHEKNDDLPAGQIKLQIILGKPKTVKIHQIIIPTGL